VERTRPDSDWYRDLSLMAGDVFYVMRTDPDQALEFMTDTVQDVLGYSAQEFFDGGLEFMAAIVDPRDVEELLAAVEMEVGASHYLELRWQHPQGRTVFAQHWMHKRRRPDGSVVVEGNTREVTTLRRLESELRESEARFGNAMRSSAIAMCLVSPAGQFLEVNPALCELLERDETTLQSTTWQMLTHPGDLNTDVSLVDDVLAGRRDSYRLLKRFMRPDRTVVWGDMSVSCVRDEGGRVRYFVSQIVDMTVQMAVEQALRESEEQYRLLAEESSDFIIRSEGPQGRIVWISPSVTRVTGWTPEELVGTDGLQLVHPDDVEQVRHGQEIIDAGRQAAGRSRVLCKDGTYKWMEQVAHTLTDSDGRILGRIGSFKDIDAQVRAEQALAASEAAARADRARLQATMDAMLDPHFLIRPVRDDAGRIVDFQHVEANGAGLAHAGVTREQLTSGTLLTVQPGQDALVAQLARVVDSGEPLVEDAVAFADPTDPAVTRMFDLRAVRVGDDLSVTIRDVTAREEAARALAESQERYRLLAENATDVIFRLDIHGVVEWVSDGVTAVLGGEPASYVGTDMVELIAPEDREPGVAAFYEARDGLRSTLRLRLLDRSGQPRWIEANLRVVTGADGVMHFVGGCRDVQAEVEALAELDRKARTDQLTGLLNREEVMTRLRLLLDGDRTGPFGVAYCDVDAFKQVNDTLGHAAGDALLIEAATRIRAIVREGDVVARVGGDELVVLLPGVHTIEHALRIGEKLRTCLHEPFDTDAGSVHSTMSIGITLALPGEDPEAVISRADHAMYRAKQLGRDQVVGA
jgi:diguanylate cyclase (GGDEF)-like protein/PAS domain S-box-containing protein